MVQAYEYHNEPTPDSAVPPISAIRSPLKAGLWALFGKRAVEAARFCIHRLRRNISGNIRSRQENEKAYFFGTIWSDYKKIREIQTFIAEIWHGF